MNPEEFVENIKLEIESTVSLYSEGANGQTELGSKLDSLNLSSIQREEVLSLIKLGIEVSTFTLISAIEGSASLNDSQEMYKVISENGDELTGELDDLFYEKVIEQPFSKPFKRNKNI